MGVTAAQLLDPNQRVACASTPRLSVNTGIYALFVVTGSSNAWEALRINAEPSGLLYVGVATDGLDRRYHPAERSCRTSSPRFSFGAMLHDRIVPHLKPAAATSGQRAQWRFEPESEAQLSAWMQANLSYNAVEWRGSRKELEACEDRLIRLLKPPLNIKLLRGEDRRLLKAVRAACKATARARRDAGSTAESVP